MKRFVAMIAILFILSVLAGCNTGGLSPSPSPTSISLPPLDFDQNSTPVSLTDTTNWSRFSFPEFSIDLPRNWQVVSNNSDYTNITIKTIDTSTPNFTLTAVKSPPFTSDPSLTINDSPAISRSTDTSIIYQINHTPSSSYILDFSGTLNHQEFVDLALSTLSFHRRGRL